METQRYTVVIAFTMHLPLAILTTGVPPDTIHCLLNKYLKQLTLLVAQLIY